jgi:hypothetical protein
MVTVPVLTIIPFAFVALEPKTLPVIEYMAPPDWVEIPAHQELPDPADTSPVMFIVEAFVVLMPYEKLAVPMPPLTLPIILTVPTPVWARP